MAVRGTWVAMGSNSDARRLGGFLLLHPMEGAGRVEPNNFPRSTGVERFLPATHKGDKRQEEGGEDRLELREEEVEGDRALGWASPPPGPPGAETN